MTDEVKGVPNPLRTCQRHSTPKTYVGSGEFGVWLCPQCSDEGDEKKREHEAERRRIEKARRQADINRRLDNAMIAPRFSGKTFAGYVAGTDAQAEVLRSMREFYDLLADGARPAGLILTGRPGTGKNHLACALVNDAVTNLGMTGLVTTAMKITREIKASWREGGEQKVLRSFVEPDLLVVDEIGVQFASETELVYLTEIINDRYEWLRPTVLLSNLPITGAQSLTSVLGSRAIDRFKDGGKVLVFNWESYRGVNGKGK